MDAAFLARARAFAEAQFPDTCRITRPGEGKGPFNNTTGKYDSPPPVVVYEGACRIPKRDNMSTATGTGGEASWEVGEYPLALPVTSDGYDDEVKPGHTVTYLTATDDPSLAGNVYGITEVADQSQASVRRFRMKRTVSS